MEAEKPMKVGYKINTFKTKDMKMPSIFPMNTGIALCLLLKHLKSQCKFGRENKDKVDLFH